MLYQQIKKCLLTGIGCLFPFTTMSAPAHYPDNQQLYDLYPWSLMYYYGQTVSNPLLQIFKTRLRKWPENIQSLELAHTLSEQNWLRRLVSPLVGIVELAGNMTIRYGKNEQTIYEFDPYLIFRWANFPWNHYVNTSLGLAEGVSYDTAVPDIEKRQNSNTKRLLNYLMFEATFAAPMYPRLQVLARIHHRSGAYGLYRAGNTGSNNVGIGMRYLFN
jgi:hypothetical protein